MSDNAESPTESQKEEPQPPSEDSTTNDQKKKSKQSCIYVCNNNRIYHSGKIMSRQRIHACAVQCDISTIDIDSSQ